MSLPRYSYRMMSMPVAGQFLSYLEDQFSLAQKLSKAVRSRITLRLYNEDYGWNEDLRWRDRFPDMKTYMGAALMEEQLCESSLCIN